MAKGPNELRGPSAADNVAIDELEQLIDRSTEFSNFRSGSVTVKISAIYLNNFLRTRPDIRMAEIIRRYREAGWLRVKFVDYGVEFSDVDNSAGRETCHQHAI